MAIKVAFFVYLINVFLFLILWFPFKKYFLGVGPVVDVSMEETFHDHDMVLERIYPFCFKFYKPRVGDIVAFQFLENNERHYLAKRCVAISGDKIQIINNKVFLNGKKSYEPYVKIDNKLKNNDVSNYGPVTVEDGKIFVLGDNRRNSMDSRVIGRVPISSVCGEAVLKLWDNKKKKFCLSTLTY